MQTLILATLCHSIHQQFSLRIIVGDAACALEDNACGSGPAVKKNV